MRPPEPAHRSPVFDRTVGMALILAVCVETASVVHWAGQTTTRIEQLEHKAALTHPINLRLARLEEQMTAARRSLVRIEHDLNIAEAAND